MNNINCCKCTCENPTCSCHPTEVTAYKDTSGKLHPTQKEASIASVVNCVRDAIPYRFDGYTPNVTISDIEKVVKALANLNLLKIEE